MYASNLFSDFIVGWRPSTAALWPTDTTGWSSLMGGKSDVA